MKTVWFSEAQSRFLLQKILEQKWDFEYVYKKNELVIFHNHRSFLTFRMPISMTFPQEDFFIPIERVNYLLILIRSGMASIGYFQDGKLLDHKVFRAYMVRKKQGTSQIKHLKTKGKSRAGSRVRLAQTVTFFEEINSRLKLYFGKYPVDKIGLSCPVTLIPYFFRSKIPPPFPKKDERIFKIPKHIPNPTYETLIQVNEFLLMGQISYAEDNDSLVKNLIKPLEDKKWDGEKEDNW